MPADGLLPRAVLLLPSFPEGPIRTVVSTVPPGYWLRTRRVSVAAAWSFALPPMPIIFSGAVRDLDGPDRAGARELGMPTCIPFSTFIECATVFSNGAAAIFFPRPGGFFYDFIVSGGLS